jgi:hypothetical protein
MNFSRDAFSSQDIFNQPSLLQDETGIPQHTGLRFSLFTLRLAQAFPQYRAMSVSLT